MIINLTQHPASSEQIEAGVVDIGGEDRQLLRDLLTFEAIPSPDNIDDRAFELTALAVRLGATHAMIGGAPYLMSTLEAHLSEQNIQPLYAFTQRVVEECDGVKKSVFKHAGFVSA